MIGSTTTRYSKEFLYYTNDEMIGRSLQLYGEYSQREVTFLTSILTKQSVVYDIGANIGYHTTAFASVAGHVFAFEPHPKNFSLLIKNTAAFNNVSCLPFAISDQCGTGWIKDFDPEAPGNFGAVAISSTVTGVETAMIAIDQTELPAPDLIKIDVEGHEWSVIKGCANMIKKRKPVIFYEAIESGNLGDIYNFLCSLEYNLYWAQSNNYNADNFLSNSNNVFGESALISVLAWPSQFGTLSLTPVIGPEDSPNKFYANSSPHR